MPSDFLRRTLLGFIWTGRPVKRMACGLCLLFMLWRIDTIHSLLCVFLCARKVFPFFGEKWSRGLVRGVSHGERLLVTSYHIQFVIIRHTRQRLANIAYCASLSREYII
jgi:hypothetical protein